MYDAIILAGGTNNKALAKLTAQPYEALIEIDGRPMVLFVAEALAASSRVGRILVVGPQQQLTNYQFPANTDILEGGQTILESISIGMAALGNDVKVLVSTADIPLLTTAAVNDFLRQCDQNQADLYYPVVPYELNNQHYPGTQRTYVKLLDGTFTGGNLFLVNTAIVPRCMKIAARIINHRKKPWKLASILGWSFLFRFMIGRLSLNAAQQRASDILGIRGAVVVSSHPELGIDVDKASDLIVARDVIRLAHNK